MDLSSIKDAYISSIPVQSIWLNQIKIWSRDPYNIPPAIKSAMVLWYDISKQGAANESMAENPILKDLSGNGHDATCYNFAWSGMSGIGGYNWNFNEFIRNFHPHTHSTIHLDFNNLPTQTPNDVFEEYIRNTNGELDNTIVKGVKIKVRGIVNSIIALYIQVNFSGDSINNYREEVIIKQDGLYELPDIDLSKFSNDTIVEIYYGFAFRDSLDTSDVVDIEQLPQYPNALVSDGVDDYAYVEGLPVLTDYTVIAKRTIINLNKNASMFVSKSTYPLGNDGAFQFEGSNDTGVAKLVSSFGNIRILKEYNADVVSYMTPLSYNGDVLSKGENIDTDKLVLFRFSTRSDILYGEVAMNSLILFNRTLTSEEIEWVKANLINGYPTPNVYYDCSLYTNETVDSANPVLKDLSGHRHDLALKNFAFAGMSGFSGFVFDAGNLSVLYRDVISIVGNKITLNSKPQDVVTAGNVVAASVGIQGEAGQSVNINIPAFKVKVSGLPDGITLSYNYSTSTNSRTSYNWLGDKSFGNGITEIPAIKTILTPDSETDYCYCNPCRLLFNTLANEESFSNITIEILPEYENALVFDGVDDYGAGTKGSFDKCTMLMLFKPIDVDGTISVDFRQTTDDINFAVYRYAANAAYNTRNKNGTYINNRENKKLTAYSLINKKQLVTIKGDITNIIEFVIGANCSKDDLYDKMALYKFLLFDQELTQEQIDKVIQDYHLMDDVDDVWNQ